MRKFLSEYSVEVTLIILIPTFLYSMFMQMATGTLWPVRVQAEYWGIRDNLKPLDADTLSKSLSYDVYKRIKDSIDNVRRLKNGDFQNGIYANLGGVIKMKIFTDAQIKKYDVFDDGNKVKADYYFELPIWVLKERDGELQNVLYHVENKQAFLRVFDYKKEDARNLMVRKDIPIPFKINPDKKTILIPISKTTFSILSVLWWVIISTFFAIYIYIVVGAIKVLIAIAKGKVFTTNNVERLRTMTIFYIFVTFFGLVASLLYRLIFSSYFNKYIEMKTEDLKNLFQDIIILLILFFVYKAFKRGYKLQQDNELTV